jgi:arabinofuranosyltransferase
VPWRLTRQHIALIVILIAAGVGLYAGWRLFWFLTDDAFIAFRYVSNSRLGYGYVWNPPPFKPVEGYTSFLWVVLLDVIWRLTGVAPPDSSNVVALVFAAGTLLVTVAMVMRLRLGPALARYRLALLVLVLIGTLTNRTFLAWTSSGLETAMFNFWLTAWVFVALSWQPGSTRWLALLALLAALMELTRPDGLLFLAATLALIALDLWQRRQSRSLGLNRSGAGQIVAALSPFLLTALHLSWRWLTYGAWLPNTYLAKYTGPWPESGIRYLLSFIIEYSYWFWLALVAWFTLILLRRLRSPLALARRWVNEPLKPAAVQTVIIGALATHFAYYTFIIGGDHFEYRVYSHLVPLLLVSFLWLLNALFARPFLTLAPLALSMAAGLPIPWTHFVVSQRYTTRVETFAMHPAIAPYFPGPVRPYLEVFDSLQEWLSQHAVGVRYQEHKVFLQYQLSTLPSREAGLLLRPEAQAVRIEGAVGAIGWVLPTAAIIDAHGLNDPVIARAPIDPAAPRVMAHDRVPPEGYLDCFQTNMAAPINKIIVAQRAADLDSLVPLCESTDWLHPSWRPSPAGYRLAPDASRVLDNVWMPDPVFVYYVPPEQAPVQPPAALSQVFARDYHDTGCLVYPAESTAQGFEFAFLPANLRYSPEELRDIFPWANLVDFKRTSEPRPYNSAYALPAIEGARPEPQTPHAVEWAPANLLGYQMTASEFQPGGVVEMELYFRTNVAAKTEQWFQLRLVDPARPEAMLASDQADPCRGMYPAWLWEPAQTIIAKTLIYLPPDLPSGKYDLRVSMFDLAVGPDKPLVAMGDTTLLTLHLP